MRNFQHIVSGLDVLPLAMALQRKPWLWGNSIRTLFPNSPHAEVEDILLRFEDIAGLNPDDPELDRKGEEAERVWQPGWYELPEVRALISPLMLRVGAYELARVILTRLAPGGTIAAHADVKGAYANLPDIARYHLVIQGHPGSVFQCGDEAVQMKTGEAWWFNAHAVHAVENNSADDRIHMLVDVRVI